MKYCCFAPNWLKSLVLWTCLLRLHIQNLCYKSFRASANSLQCSVLFFVKYRFWNLPCQSCTEALINTARISSVTFSELLETKPDPPALADEYFFIKLVWAQWSKSLNSTEPCFEQMAVCCWTRQWVWLFRSEIYIRENLGGVEYLS